ncbi:MAG: hypothetical protein PSX79_12685 [bacterium]|nr:hypothetical protein [bacterium]
MITADAATTRCIVFPGGGTLSGAPRKVRSRSKDLERKRAWRLNFKQRALPLHQKKPLLALFSPWRGAGRLL